ncbi:Aste57867_12689 [Aphanomyces stellatus]|uniref:Aste57867_12689 protein n=1 Tax=Aphanomyces stellatus TaxID=120398 RepID=A0A485KW85_9STRA|nr:hypothetical protein As57867_012642 [Aphanomyces stellatus]VFT89539.1 Aste57867_12689 [Aphanomyces stellatus]
MLFSPPGRAIALICGALLITVVCYDIVLTNILLQRTTHCSEHDTNLGHAAAVRSRPTDLDTDEQEATPTCRVQFVFAGTKSNYKHFSSLRAWLRLTNPTCPIEFIRPGHPFLVQVSAAERATMDDMAYLPILQADFMKLLVLYYFGGLVTDLDTEPLKRFPDDWTGAGTKLATCDVVLGVEADCFDDKCVATMVRKGQIQNWSMWARTRHSPFVRQLVDAVVTKYATFVVRHDPNVAVQEVAGSGTITDFVKLYGGFRQPHYRESTGPMGATLECDWSSVLRIRKAGEEVCVVGPAWTGTRCSGATVCLLRHKYEGSWRVNPANADDPPDEASIRQPILDFLRSLN